MLFPKAGPALPFSADEETAQEYLGDLVNFAGHQRAAHDMLTSLVTPALVLTSPMHNSVLEWYSRFDIQSALASGRPNALSREWVSIPYHHYQERIATHPDSLQLKCEERMAISRVMAADVGNLFAKNAADPLSTPEFQSQLDALRLRLAQWYEIGDERVLAAARRMRGGDDEVTTPGVQHPWEPIDLCEGELWGLNYALIHTWTTEVVSSPSTNTPRRDMRY